MKRILNLLIIFLFLISCGSKNLGSFGKGVNITFDPRTVGMQIDDTIMQKNLIARLTLKEKKYFLSIQVEVLDGRIFLTGKVGEPEEKIKITKLAWETKGVRSVKNAIQIRGRTNLLLNLVPRFIRFLTFPAENELYPCVIFFKPNLDKIFSNGKNSPKGTRLILLYTDKISNL